MKYLHPRRGMPRFPLLGSMIFLLAACSAAGPKFSDTPFATEPVPGDKARIILFRGSDSNFQPATVGIDGAVVGALTQSGFIVADAEPGDRKIGAWLRYAPVRASGATMSVKAGEVITSRFRSGSSASPIRCWGRSAWLFGSLTRKGSFTSSP